MEKFDQQIGTVLACVFVISMVGLATYFMITDDTNDFKISEKVYINNSNTIGSIDSIITIKDDCMSSRNIIYINGHTYSQADISKIKSINK